MNGLNVKGIRLRIFKIHLFFLISFFSSSVFAASMYAIGNGGTVYINEWGTGYNVTNNCGPTIMVPTNSAGEWSTFIAAHPGCVTLAASCSGASVGGYCWYWGGDNQSCNTVCGGHGGYNNATRTYAGDIGSDGQCTAVLNALGLGGSAAADNACPSGLGCGQYGGSSLRRCYTYTTDAASQVSPYIRACACNS